MKNDNFKDLLEALFWIGLVLLFIAAAFVIPVIFGK